MEILLLLLAWIVAVAILSFVTNRHRSLTMLVMIALVVIMVFAGKKIYISAEITISEYVYAILFSLVFTIITFISRKILYKFFNQIKLS